MDELPHQTRGGVRVRLRYEVNVGVAPARSPNTTRPMNEHGRSKNDTAAPPTVCLSGLPYIDGCRHAARLFAGSSGSTQSANV